MPIFCCGRDGAPQQADWELLKSNPDEYLRSGNLLLTPDEDLDDYLALKDPTMQQRCIRAALLRMFYNNRYGSSRYWYREVSALNNAHTSDDKSEKYEAMLLAEERNKGRRRWRDRAPRKPQRNARKRWRKVRAFVRLRAITVHWQERTRVALSAQQSIDAVQ